MCLLTLPILIRVGALSQGAAGEGRCGQRGVFKEGSIRGVTATETPRTYMVRTLGCQMNVHDSERMKGLLLEAGYVEATTVGAGGLMDEAAGADVRSEEHTSELQS